MFGDPGSMLSSRGAASERVGLTPPQRLYKGCTAHNSWMPLTSILLLIQPPCSKVGPHSEGIPSKQASHFKPSRQSRHSNAKFSYAPSLCAASLTRVVVQHQEKVRCPMPSSMARLPTKRRKSNAIRMQQSSQAALHSFLFFFHCRNKRVTLKKST
ncbi:hypothetical protein DL546_009915 [Coniochaeta pulveracea]|uniref:Uncharacterized protein n=1 Tax=Coniochaeta pulveracea TaxID=177199 RepID=A0A420Y9E1_9PEZI|nr:hypothetical protein DL546_009915 [Coniochaeta pulveracea]